MGNIPRIWGSHQEGRVWERVWGSHQEGRTWEMWEVEENEWGGSDLPALLAGGR